LKADGSGISLIGLWTDDIVMMWDSTIPTAKMIKASLPDIFLRNKKNNTRLLVDISCPAGGNIDKRVLRSWRSTRK
jgi:hypothetical protein